MALSRREFLATGAMAASTAALGAPAAALGSPGPIHDDPRYLIGDPYRGAVEEPGLGGASFESARQRALLWRTPPAVRDRAFLGLEVIRA